MQYEPLNESNLARFLEYVSFKESGCWIWFGNPTSPYGKWKVIGTKYTVYVHRQAAYWWIDSEIPDNLYVDHKECGNKKCVNPDHLEIVSHAENDRRAKGWINGKCKRGHDITNPDNLGNGLARGKPYVYCKGCQKLASQKSEASRKSFRKNKSKAKKSLIDNIFTNSWDDVFE